MKPEREQDRLLDHEYDGIREYDNPLPRWWIATFYVTIIFAVLYLLNLPGIGIGKGRIAAYEADMAEAAALAAAHDPLRGITADTILTAERTPAIVAAGKLTFTSTCAPCHAADGGGIIGPNLTDDYWLHGGSPLELLQTVNAGVLEKGMPPWGKSLKREQLIAVVAYVMTLRGTTPAKPKAPQGVLLRAPGGGQ